MFQRTLIRKLNRDPALEGTVSLDIVAILALIVEIQIENPQRDGRHANQGLDRSIQAIGRRSFFLIFFC